MLDRGRAAEETLEPRKVRGIFGRRIYRALEAERAAVVYVDPGYETGKTGSPRRRIIRARSSRRHSRM